MILVRKYLTASNSDVLNGTDLAAIPRDGMLFIYAASDANDNTLTVTGTNIVPPSNAQPIQKTDADAIIDVGRDIPLIVKVTKGGNVKLDFTLATAGDTQIVALLK